MIKYLIIDDEHIAHDIIEGYCDTLGYMQLMKHCYDAIEALDYLRQNTVDIIFLDLNMPKLKGFDFLKTLSFPPKIIVTTAYKEFALEGYELEIIDYLLKPFSFERFLKAVNKTIDTKKLSNASVSISETPNDETIFLHSNKKHIQVRIEDVLYVEAAGNYTKVVLIEDQILIRGKISDMLKTLSNQDFIQVHKSFVIAKRHINNIEGNRITINGDIIPVGKMYKSNLNKILK